MPRARHAASAVLATMVWAAASAAPAQARIQAVIVQWGEMEVGEPQGLLGPEYQEHALGQGHEVAFERFINHDDHIPAQLCRSFGFRAWLAGGPGDVLPDRILVRVSHPTITRPDGVSGTVDTLMLPVTPAGTGTSFGFDDPWEVQPGDWTFDLVLDGAVIASKTFVATVPTAMTPRPPICPGQGVS